MNNELRKEIHSRMNLKETNELLIIWQTNNRAEWSDEAFDVIKDILIDRGEVILEQNEPVYENIEKDDKELSDDGLEEWEAKILDDDDQPEFYNVPDVILLRKNINLTTKAVVYVLLATGLTTIPYFVSMFSAFVPGRNDLKLPIYILAFIMAILGSAVSIAITYYPLKALNHILHILMQMEFRSRKADRSGS